MAFTPSPTSPTAPTIGSGHAGRRSATPPAQPLTKRDKRRSALQDRFDGLSASFNQNRDPHFRDQIKALQVDMTLVVAADPYKSEPLDDSAEDIARKVDRSTAVNNHPNSADLGSLAGRYYQEYVHAVNESKEARDVDLTALIHRHESTLASLKHECDFKLRFASEECALLGQTLRERLIQTIGAKKAKLVKEKEHLDIADTNALLLHPSQFSITNPASPGGVHGNRNTRHTRHKRVELDELGNHLAAENLKSRKRKLPMDDDLGSPGHDGASTPFERAKARQVAHQTAPLYSIERLFTDKELTLHSNNAHVATAHFFAISKQSQKNNGPNGSGVATHLNETDGEEPSGDTTGQEDDVALEAPEMDRSASQNFHQTRSTRNAGASGLSFLADLSDKVATRPNLPYFVLQNYHPKPGNAAPPVPGLLHEEANADMATFERLRANNSKGWIDKELVEELMAPIEEQPSWSTLADEWPRTMDVHMVDVSARSSLSDNAAKSHWRMA